MKYATRTMRSGDFIKVQTVECVFDSSYVSLPFPLRRRRQFFKGDPNSRQTLLAGAGIKNAGEKNSNYIETKKLLAQE